MKNKTIFEEYAKEHGFDAVGFVFEWNGHSACPLLRDYPVDLGVRNYVLYKDDELRTPNAEEFEEISRFEESFSSVWLRLNAMELPQELTEKLDRIDEKLPVVINALEQECEAPQVLQLKNQLVAAYAKYQDSVTQLKELSNAPVLKAGLFAEISERISRVSFRRTSFGGNLGFYKAIVEGDKTRILLSLGRNIKREQLITRIVDTKDYLEGFKALNLTSWTGDYTNNNILDGEQWQLVLEFNDMPPIIIKGSNAYPDNFEKASKFFGLTRNH